MKTFKDLGFGRHPNAGVVDPIGGGFFYNRASMKFDNGWGVSVITGGYGDEEKPYELAVLLNGSLHYDNPVAEGDVRGYLTEEDVTELMKQVQEFEKVN